MGSLTDFVSNTRLLQCVYNRLLSCEMNAQDALKGHGHLWLEWN